MSYKFFIILSLVPTIMCITDYCDEELCRYYSAADNTTVVIAHIGCNNTGEFSPECVKPEMIKLDNDFKKYILDQHNSLRNKLAVGNVTKLPSASRMPTLLWNDEFAQLAELAAKQCEGIRDKCRNTEKFHYVGQNIGQILITNETDYKYFVKFIIDEWFSESALTNKSDIEKYRAADPHQTYEHFGVMASDKVTEIGCACIKFQSSEKDKDEYLNSVMLVCNYSFSNFIGQPVYVAGDTASKCKTGTNSKFSGLCSGDEIVEAVPEEVETVPKST